MPTVASMKTSLIAIFTSIVFVSSQSFAGLVAINLNGGAKNAANAFGVIALQAQQNFTADIMKQNQNNLNSILNAIPKNPPAPTSAFSFPNPADALKKAAEELKKAQEQAAKELADALKKAQDTAAAKEAADKAAADRARLNSPDSQTPVPTNTQSSLDAKTKEDLKKQMEDKLASANANLNSSTAVQDTLKKLQDEMNKANGTPSPPPSGSGIQGTNLPMPQGGVGIALPPPGNIPSLPPPTTGGTPVNTGSVTTAELLDAMLKMQNALQQQTQQQNPQDQQAKIEQTVKEMQKAGGTTQPTIIILDQVQDALKKAGDAAQATTAAAEKAAAEAAAKRATEDAAKAMAAQAAQKAIAEAAAKAAAEAAMKAASEAAAKKAAEATAKQAAEQAAKQAAAQAAAMAAQKAAADAAARAASDMMAKAKAAADAALKSVGGVFGSVPTTSSAPVTGNTGVVGPKVIITATNSTPTTSSMPDSVKKAQEAAAKAATDAAAKQAAAQAAQKAADELAAKQAAAKAAQEAAQKAAAEAAKVAAQKAAQDAAAKAGADAIAAAAKAAADAAAKKLIDTQNAAAQVVKAVGGNTGVVKPTTTSTTNQVGGITGRVPTGIDAATNAALLDFVNSANKLPANNSNVSSQLSSLSAKDSVVADIYQFMALFQQMSQEMRNTNREIRAADLQNQMTAIMASAEQMKEAADKRYTTAITSVATQLVGGISQIAGAAASARAVQTGSASQTTSSAKDTLSADTKAQLDAAKTKLNELLSKLSDPNLPAKEREQLTVQLDKLTGTLKQLAASSGATKTQIDAMDSIIKSSLQLSTSMEQGKKELLQADKDKIGAQKELLESMVKDQNQTLTNIINATNAAKDQVISGMQSGNGGGTTFTTSAASSGPVAQRLAEAGLPPDQIAGVSPNSGKSVASVPLYQTAQTTNVIVAEQKRLPVTTPAPTEPPGPAPETPIPPPKISEQ